MSYTAYPGWRGLKGKIYRHPYTTCPCEGCSVITGPTYFKYRCPDGSVIGPVYQESAKKKKTRKSPPKKAEATFGWRKGRRGRRRRR